MSLEKSNVRQQRKVGLFVDWNSQVRAVPPSISSDPIERNRFAIKAVGKLVARELCRLDSSTFFRVRVRLYHGWTSGVTFTENRKAVARIPEYMTPDDIFPSARVVCLSELEFGDRLIDALPERESAGLGIHLPNTLRRQDGRSPPREKMVDTALGADLLSWARSEPTSLAIVLASDDDLVPPVFVAEAWMRPYGGAVKLVQPASVRPNRFLRLEGLSFEHA